VKSRIIKQFNGNVDATKDIGPGAAVVSYVGHGAWQDWGSNNTFFFGSSGSDSVSSLTNGSKLSLVLIADCISGAFAGTSPVANADITYTMSEAFLVRAS